MKLQKYCIIRNYLNRQYLSNSHGFVTWCLDYRDATRFYQYKEDLDFDENELEELENVTFEIIELFEIERN